MNRRRFLSIAGALMVATVAQQLGAKELPKVAVRYPHLEYERVETNAYTGERRFEIRVAHGPREWTVASSLDGGAGRHRARTTAWHA